jgi:hypothetical protein
MAGHGRLEIETSNPNAPDPEHVDDVLAKQRILAALPTTIALLAASLPDASDTRPELPRRDTTRHLICRTTRSELVPDPQLVVAYQEFSACRGTGLSRQRLRSGV